MARPELKDILDKLKARFGDRCCPILWDPEWLGFEVTGLTNFVLIHMLEGEQEQLFGKSLENFQIVTEQTGKERGVYIRYIPNAAARDRIAPGFWYY
jgi:hypothetical protein